jgi:hypothetical protein
VTPSNPTFASAPTHAGVHQEPSRKLQSPRRRLSLVGAATLNKPEKKGATRARKRRIEKIEKEGNEEIEERSSGRDRRRELKTQRNKIEKEEKSRRKKKEMRLSK